MASLGIFFGSDSGNTENVVNMVAEKLTGAGIENEVFDIAEADVESFADYDILILACPTYDDGQLQAAWEEKIEDVEGFDFSGKKVALIGLGDQESYPDMFVDAIGTLANIVTKGGGELFGAWPTDGYDYEVSKGIGPDGKFYGLVIDQDNQEDLTEGRIDSWLALVKATLEG